ncbi:MAG: hypothetical protein Q9M19_01320 [Mariprofundaceae bacterium]|nr:hypothetical protein [Mariprofundaceae bacterium]
MNVYDAAANMIAFSEFSVEVARALYGDSAKAEANVSGFGKGSFVTDMVIHLGGAVSSLFSQVSAKDVLSIMHESITLWKHLQGFEPKALDKSDNHVAVTNHYGDILQVKAETVKLVFSEKSADATSKFIRDALDHDGIDSVSVQSDEFAGDLVLVHADEAQWFKNVSPELPLDDFEVTQSLMVEAPVFKDGNKWRFSDATGSFHAAIRDKRFIAEVDAGKPFAKGDMMRVRMRIYQCQKGEKLVGEKEILEVIEHKQRAYQSSMQV